LETIKKIENEANAKADKIMAEARKKANSLE
jgi:vacuolar-type H+-ATPase subunit E/Vma4